MLFDKEGFKSLEENATSAGLSMSKVQRLNQSKNEESFILNNPQKCIVYVLNDLMVLYLEKTVL